MNRLKRKAKKLLESNHRRGTTTLYGDEVEYSFTCPSPHGYRHQWLWDSCFHAIVLSHLNPKRGKEEIETLLKTQRDDGFIPIVTYWEGISSFNERVFTYPYTQGKTQTITQPPVVALAVERVYEKTGDKEFLKRVLPGVKRLADYFNDSRDIDNDHLVSVIHAWETGMDSLPAYDKPAGITSTHPDELETLKTLFKPIWHYFFMDWDEEMVTSSGIFDVEDVMVNCIHAQSQRSLARLLEEIGDDSAAKEYQKKADLTEDAILQHCWNEEDGMFYSLNKDNSQLAVKTITSFFPLILDSVPKDMLDRLVNEHLTNPEEFWAEYPVTTVSLDEPTFDPGFSHALWRGPTWISTNWFLIRGLEKHGYDDIAEELSEKTINLIQKEGFREYFNPFTGEGNGMKEFSWSTLVVDLLQD